MSTETIQLKVIEKPLTAREQMMLAEYEHTIIKDFAAFYRVGQALAEINRLRLYRTEEGRTFKQYCKELWDVSESRAYELMDASGIYNYLQLQNESENSANGGDLGDTQERKLPINERQVRPLTRFKGQPDKIRELWHEATSSAPNGKVTASYINKVVKNYLGDKIKKTVHKAQKKAIDTCSGAFSAAFTAFSDQIIEERKAGYKHTSRGFIVRALDQLRAEMAEDGEAIEDTILHGESSDLNKLQNAGYSLFRSDRASMTVRKRSETGGWSKYSGPFDTAKELDAAFKAILQDDKHLRG